MEKIRKRKKKKEQYITQRVKKIVITVVRLVSKGRNEDWWKKGLRRIRFRKVLYGGGESIRH